MKQGRAGIKPKNSMRMTFPSIARIRISAKMLPRALLVLAALIAVPDWCNAEARHAIAMHGEPAWPAGFTTPPYANPQAPKGGRLVQGALGTFDSLNPLILKGTPAQSIRAYVIESLMARGYSEPFTLYGLIADSVETDDARSFVTFTIDPRAHFSDGKPITPEDVVFSWQLLRDKGRRNLQIYYAKVKSAEISGRSVRFDLSGADDRELPLILGLMPVLPKHAVNPDTFDETSLEPPIGSGPYRITQVRPGESVTLTRDPNYWGRDLPINRGLWNFDEVRFDYYRDANTHFEAFKKGLYDVREETDPGRWSTQYDFPALRDGRVVKEGFPYGLPKPMNALVFNTRRAIFSDVRVREAIGYLLDSEWLNKNFYFGLFRRTSSYFEGSELSFAGRPADERERVLLDPFPGAVRADVMDGSWRPPASDGTGRDRDNLRKAFALFAQAGYALDGTVLRNRATGAPFEFEIAVTTKDAERLALAFVRDLKRAGINARVRLVENLQFTVRQNKYDYDMIPYKWELSLSPGNEQTFYWSSAAADQEGTRNYMGAKNPAIDAVIAAMLRGRERADLVAAARALDRLLISGFYVVPLFYLPEQWVARWNAIEHPAATSLFGYLPETWWHKP